MFTRGKHPSLAACQDSSPLAMTQPPHPLQPVLQRSPRAMCRLSDSETRWLQQRSLPRINSSLAHCRVPEKPETASCLQNHMDRSPWRQCHAVCKHPLATQGYFGNPSVTGNDPNLVQIYERIIWIKNLPVFHSGAGSVLFLTAAISMSPELSPLELQTLISIIFI